LAQDLLGLAWPRVLSRFINPIDVATDNGHAGEKLSEAPISQADQVVIFEQ